MKYVLCDVCKKEIPIGSPKHAVVKGINIGAVVRTAAISLYDVEDGLQQDFCPGCILDAIKKKLCS